MKQKKHLVDQQKQKSLRILVIDDNEGILEGFEEILKSAGYQVDTSLDGEILLQLRHASNGLPSLIILDVLLSGKDGRDICKELKKYPKTRHIPVIMVSAHPHVEASIHACGADAFLKKPFEMEELLEKVAFSLQNRAI